MKGIKKNEQQIFIKRNSFSSGILRAKRINIWYCWETETFVGYILPVRWDIHYLLQILDIINAKYTWILKYCLSVSIDALLKIFQIIFHNMIAIACCSNAHFTPPKFSGKQCLEKKPSLLECHSSIHRSIDQWFFFITKTFNSIFANFFQFHLI